MKKNSQETKTFKAGEIIYSHNDPAEFITALTVAILLVVNGDQ